MAESEEMVSTLADEEDDKPKLDSLGRAYSTGKRKDAVARVWIKKGNGKITVNKKPLEKYFARPTLQMIIQQAFSVCSAENQFDVMATVKGGGLSGQAGAVRHGLSKALTIFDGELRGVLKAAGFLTRDSRVVERKKYGRRKTNIKPVFTSIKLYNKKRNFGSN